MENIFQNLWANEPILFAKLPGIIVVRDILPSSFKFKRGILPPLTKYILTWILLVISSQNFSWELSIKLFENLLLAKYLMNVPATLKTIGKLFPNFLDSHQKWFLSNNKKRRYCYIWRNGGVLVINISHNIFFKKNTTLEQNIDG